MNTLGELQNVGDNDKVLAFSQSGQTYGLVSVGKLTANGYAGVRWPKDASSPVGEPCGSLDKLRALPSLLGLGGYLVQNDHTRRKLSASDHELFEDGTAALLDGSMGHYQWGWGIKFYYASWEDEDYTYEAVDTKPIPGKWNYVIPVASRSCAGFATVDRQENRLVSYVNSATRYRGGNNESTLDGAFNTQLKRPATNMPHITADTYARVNGSMWGCNMYMMFFITGALKRIIFHNKDIQASAKSLDSNLLYQGGTGGGPTNLLAEWNNYPYIPLDAGVNDGDITTGSLSITVTGSDGNGKTVSGIQSFFGLKMDYAYLAALENGSVLQNNADTSQSMYIMNAWDGSPLTSDPAGMKLAGRLSIPGTSSSWYGSKKQNHAHLIMFPTQTGGTVSTFDCDSYYFPCTTSGLRVPYRLGHADDGGHAGSCCLSGRHAVGAAYALCGLVLCEANEVWSAEPVMGS